MTYDYLVIGAGLFGSVFAHEAAERGKKCIVIDRRKHIGGNLYCQNIEGINVHKYGPHIFHTSNKVVWKYIQKFAEFNNFLNSPIAIYKSEVYNLPINMNTFNKMWNIITPLEAKREIIRQTNEYASDKPQNLEEKVLSIAGIDIYEKLIKGYTEKQWGRSCTELPASIIERLPFRYTYDNNYFKDCYQGIPIGGYTKLIEKLLEGIDVRLGLEYREYIANNPDISGKIVYTGMIDEFYNYCFGKLEYRSLAFEDEMIECENYQGNAVVNYTDKDIPYTRIIEHKHFEFGTQPITIITREFPIEWEPGKEPYYPINDVRNMNLYQQYKRLAEKEQNVIFGGRLGEYSYYDMDKTIESALNAVKNEFDFLI